MEGVNNIGLPLALEVRERLPIEAVERLTLLLGGGLYLPALVHDILRLCMGGLPHSNHHFLRRPWGALRLGFARLRISLD